MGFQVLGHGCWQEASAPYQVGPSKGLLKTRQLASPGVWDLRGVDQDGKGSVFYNLI